MFQKPLVKLALAVVSFVSAAYFVGWFFTLILMLAIWIHEMGHVLGARLCGVRTKGFYFLPLLGGVTVIKGKITTRQKSIFVSIMGPLVGTLVAIPILLIGLVLQDPWRGVAVIASAVMFTLNASNLLPIQPLDGGEIFDCLAWDLSPKFGDLAPLPFIFALEGMIFFGPQREGVQTVILLLMAIYIWFSSLGSRYRQRQHPAMQPAQRRTYLAMYFSTLLVSLAFSWWSIVLFLNYIPKK